MVLAACSPADRGESVDASTAPLKPQIIGMHTRATAAGSDFQAALLADGVVDYAEYEEAVLATIGCLRDQGLQVFGPTLLSSGLLDFSYGGAPTREESDRQGAIGNECEEKYLFYVGMAYGMTIAPSSQERADRLVSYAQCLRDEGFDVAQTFTASDLDEISLESGEFACATEFSDTMVVSEHLG